jgi:hypothetical protein
MPIKKARLTREEQFRHLERIRELRAAGVDCELPNELQSDSHALDISIDPWEGNILCELSSGVTAYAIGVHLTALRSDVRVRSCTIESSWDSHSVVLCTNQLGLYRVGQAVSFTEAESLNHRIESGLCFHRRGDVAEGWVVASSLTPIPYQYRDRMITKLSLTFTDQFGHEHREHGEAAIERSEILRKVSRRRLPSLFEVDPKVEIVSSYGPQARPIGNLREEADHAQ